MIDRVAKTNNEMVLARIAFSKLLTRHSWDLLLHLLLYHLEMYYQYQLGLPYPPQLSPNSTPRACFSNFGYQLENPQNPIRCLIGFGLYEKKREENFLDKLSGPLYHEIVQWRYQFLIHVEDVDFLPGTDDTTLS